MTTSLASFALVLLLAGTAAAQQKQPRRSSGNKSTSTASSANAARSNSSSSATPQEGSAGVAVGTGLTNDQQQGAANASNGPTKVDANSSIRTGASPVKARKKLPKSSN